MNNVILILCDALRDDTAAHQMGYLEHLVEVKLANRYTVISELPTKSRPCYEAIHTGVPASQHGVTNNKVVRRSKIPSIFQAAVEHGKTTAAASYYFISELYIRAPYDPLNDREVDDEALLIQHGRFYSMDDYPDEELFATGSMLVRKFTPDYLLIHPMGLDLAGETYGANSSQYRNQVTRQDDMMANLIPEWLQAGYVVLVTGDHGINADKSHGGTLPDVRHVPLYLITPNGNCAGNTGETISQLQLAPTICKLLGVPIPETMKHPPIV